jgi:DNA-binding transcriptional regulator GbsR (MarR family)
MALKADIMRRKAMDGVQFVILDYAYLMNESMKLDEIARSTIISRGLKMICNELNISMLAIQSVNKEGVGRDINGNRKRLSMANLRGSSQVLHDADYDDKIQKLTLPEAELENIKYITTQKSRTLKKKKLGIFVKHPDYPAFAEYIDEIGELS